MCVDKGWIAWPSSEGPGDARLVNPHQNNGPVISVIIWRFVASYLQPVIQQYESTTVWKELLQPKEPLRKLRTISVMNGSDHVPTTKSTLFSSEQRYIKEGTGKSMKNALYVQQYGKRHLLSWSNIEQWKNQAHSLSHCRVTLVWRHQADRQAII